MDGRIVHQYKKAPEVDFEMESWFITDQPGNKNSFIQISNRGTIS